MTVVALRGITRGMECTIKIHSSESPDLICKVDPEWLPILDRLHWRLSDGGYACAATMIGGKAYKLSMHRIVAFAPEGVLVDHENGDRLDNRASNLRYADSRQNSLNRSRKARRKDGVLFKGVYAQSKAATFTARIRIEGRSAYLGSFRTADEAARAYDEAARSHFGEFAKLNFPEASAESLSDQNQALAEKSQAGHMGNDGLG